MKTSRQMILIFAAMSAMMVTLVASIDDSAEKQQQVLQQGGICKKCRSLEFRFVSQTRSYQVEVSHVEAECMIPQKTTDCVNEYECEPYTVDDDNECGDVPAHIDNPGCDCENRCSEQATLLQSQAEHYNAEIQAKKIDSWWGWPNQVKLSDAERAHLELRRRHACHERCVSYPSGLRWPIDLEQDDSERHYEDLLGACVDCETQCGVVCEERRQYLLNSGGNEDQVNSIIAVGSNILSQNHCQQSYQYI